MDDNVPSLSVIIPTYNRGSILKRSLAAFGTQTISFERFEVIVSDDGSQDNTKEITLEMEAGSPFVVRYLWQQNRGANAARNQAIGAARGSILLFINDDTIATPIMLEEHLKTHAEYPEENISVLGRMTISPDVPPSLFAKLHLDANYDLWKGQKELDWRAFYTCNVSVRKSFLLKFGLFEEKLRYHEDVELSERLAHHGFRLIYNPEALGYHYHHLQEEEYLRVAPREGKALAQWFGKSPHLGKELAAVGFHRTSPLAKRFKCFIGDLLINGATRPFLLKLARFLAEKHEELALILYRKLYQSLKREGIKNELQKRT
jgi:glycosyltransferase involved in cell wall biosynthesis